MAAATRPSITDKSPKHKITPQRSAKAHFSIGIKWAQVINPQKINKKVDRFMLFLCRETFSDIPPFS